MKAALYLVGEVRTHEEAHPSFLQHLIRPTESTAASPVDVFLYTCRTTQKKWRNRSLPKESVSDAQLDRLRNIYGSRIKRFIVHEDNPDNVHEEVRLIAENVARLGRNYPDTLRACAAHQHQWYKIYKCDQLRQEYERQVGQPYQVIIVTRFDLLFSLDVDVFEATRSAGVKPVVFIMGDPEYRLRQGFHYDGSRGVNDFFAYGDRLGMTVYSQLILNYGDYDHRTLKRPAVHPYSRQMIAEKRFEELRNPLVPMACSEYQIGLHLFEHHVEIHNTAVYATLCRCREE